MKIAALEGTYPSRIFRSPKDLPRVRKWTYFQVRRFQIAPLIEMAIKRNRRQIAGELSLCECLGSRAPVTGYGQIIFDRISRPPEELSVIDPYRVMVRYFAYMTEQIANYQRAKSEGKGWQYDKAVRDKIEGLKPEPTLERLLSFNLYTGEIFFIDHRDNLFHSILTDLDQRGEYETQGSTWHLKADSDMDWGRVYVFEVAWDERGGIVDLEVPRNEHYPFIVNFSFPHAGDCMFAFR